MPAPVNTPKNDRERVQRHLNQAIYYLEGNEPMRALRCVMDAYSLVMSSPSIMGEDS